MTTAEPGNGAFLDLMADVFDVVPQSLSEDSGPANLGTWTSRRHLELVVTLEESYGVSFSYGEIKAIQSVGAARRMLIAKGVDV